MFIACDYLINILDHSILVPVYLVLFFLGYISNVLPNVSLDWYQET